MTNNRDRRIRTAKTLSQREAQVVALIQVGATKKEISAILGIAESTVKSTQDRVRRIGRLHGVDWWGMPIDWQKRKEEFRKIAHNVTVKYNFGEIANVTSTEKNDSSAAIQATQSQ